ncbi:PilW family protein [Acinetobacter sp. B51(2017)]|uniref:PilW family protein n=1 Tax=Acinetobacter sp. B51(2017) TaxID=2060938 RepID=UPI000F097FCA|nr:PilW family protein [Acinetobacter sp. B51(2017)]
MPKLQQGFTLIELMVSIAIGLVLVAVAVQLFISGQVNYKIQQAASTVQDSGVFGLTAVTKNIRLANHGNAGTMHDQSLYGGIVLSGQYVDAEQSLAGNLHGLKLANQPIAGKDYVSAAAVNPSAFSSLNSDQLVIMYQAPVDMRTCTGRQVRGPNRGLSTMQKGWYVIEKYYVKKNADQSADLYCSDSFFIAKGEAAPQSLVQDDENTLTIEQSETLMGDYGKSTGHLIAHNVEYMRVQLLLRQPDQSTSTLDIAAYQALTMTDATQTRPAIIGINLAWLVRSNEKVANTRQNTYQVLDRSIRVPDDQFMRQTYSTTIALRNGGLGDVSQ